MTWRLAALAVLIGLMTTSDAQNVPPPPPQLYANIPLDASLLRLDKQALDEAYHQQVVKLFQVWLSRQAPSAAVEMQNGLKIARRAYAQAAAQIAQREQELQQGR